MNTDFEQQLTDALERRVSATDLTAHGRVHDLDSVRERAGHIRRRRMAVAAAGIAAVLAIAAPLGMAASGMFDSPRDSNGMIAETPPPAPVTETVTIPADAPAGKAPGIVWRDGSTIHLPDGSTLDTTGGHRAVAVVAGRVLAYRSDDETGLGTIDEIGSDGQVVDSFPAVMAPMTDPTHSVAVWVNHEGQLVRATGDGETVLEAAGRRLQPLAVDTDGTWYTPEGAEHGVRHIDLDGVITEHPELLAVNGSYDGRALTMLSYDEKEPGSCGGLLEGNRTVWKTCDYTLEAVAPGGDWVLATDDYLDGIGQGTAAILDAATGKVQVRYEMQDGVFIDRKWEDATHVLVLTYTFDNTWQVLRLGLDGSVERATTERKGPDFEPPLSMGQ